MRQNAENCREMANTAANEPSRKRYLRMAEAWEMLADNKDWLDGVMVGANAEIQPTA